MNNVKVRFLYLVIMLCLWVYFNHKNGLIVYGRSRFHRYSLDETIQFDIEDMNFTAHRLNKKIWNEIDERNEKTAELDQKISGLEDKLAQASYWPPGTPEFHLVANIAREVIELERERSGICENEAKSLHLAAADILEQEVSVK
jgi:hypothetical protein